MKNPKRKTHNHTGKGRDLRRIYNKMARRLGKKAIADASNE